MYEVTSNDIPHVLGIRRYLAVKEISTNIKKNGK